MEKIFVLLFQKYGKFEAFHNTISSGINLLFLKSAVIGNKKLVFFHYVLHFLFLLYASDKLTSSNLCFSTF